MSANQSCRYSDQIGPDYNPTCIIPELKPGRWLDNVIGVPLDSFGELFDEVMDSSTGTLYVKNENNHWEAKVNFSAVIVPADPVVANSGHFNEIQGDTGENIQINLGVAGTLSIGPALDLPAVQIQSSGVISSDAAAGTSSIFLGNGAGNQLILDPATLSLIGSPDANMTASNNITLTANAGSIVEQCATTFDISAPSGVTVFTTGSSGTFFTEGAGSIVNVKPNVIAQQGLGNLAITSDNQLNLTSTGADLNITSGGSLVLTSALGSQILLAPGGGAVVNVTPGANLVTTNIFSPTSFDITTIGGSVTASASTSLSLTGGTSASMTASNANLSLTSTLADIVLSAPAGTITSNAPFRAASGSSGVPSYSFVSDTNSGLFSAGADAVAIAAGGGSIMNFDTAQVTPNVVVRVNTDGTAASPAYSWNADTDIGLYRAAANTIGMSTNGVVRKTLDTTTENYSVHQIPTASNTYDLGSAGLPWRNIYSNNLLNVISDANKKENVEELSSGLDFINKLVPVTFRFKNRDDADTKHKVGFIAQQCEAALNESGFKSDDLDVVVKSDAGDYLMKYDSLIAFLVKSVQELSEQVKLLSGM